MFIAGNWVRIFSFPLLWSQEATGLAPPAGAALAMSPGWRSAPAPCPHRASVAARAQSPPVWVVLTHQEQSNMPRWQSPGCSEHLSPSLSAPQFWIHFSTGHGEVLLSLTGDGELGHRRFRVWFSKGEPSGHFSLALDIFSSSQNESVKEDEKVTMWSHTHWIVHPQIPNCLDERQGSHPARQGQECRIPEHRIYIFITM